MPPCHKNHFKNSISLFTIFFLLLFNCKPLQSHAQTLRAYQFSNNIVLNRPIKSNTVAEINVGYTTSSSIEKKNPFDKFSQFTFRGWLHNYYNSRWKFSCFLAFYNNQQISSIGQVANQEFRAAPQAIYYIHKRDYTLTTRMRAELRWFVYGDGLFEDAYRYRQQIKYLKPINSKIIREGIWYGIVAEELFIRFNKTTLFDRNRFTLGLGYAISDDFQIEASYLNEFLPRSAQNEMYHNISIDFVFNNLSAKIKNKFSHFHRETKSDE